jgi:hypothetical protein
MLPIHLKGTRRGDAKVEEVGLIIGLVIAGFGIWFQWQMSVESSKQLRESQSILSKLEGVSLQMRETQVDQYQQLLNAVLREKVQASTEIGAAEERLAQLEEAQKEQPQLAKELGSIREALNIVQTALSMMSSPVPQSGYIRLGGSQPPASGALNVGLGRRASIEPEALKLNADR